MPWSSVRGLIVSGFAVLVIIFAAVTMGGVLQSARHQRELEQLEFHSNRAILIQNVETEAAVSGLLLQRYVDAGGDNYPAEINAHAAAAQLSLEQVINMGNAPAGFENVTSTGLQLLRDASRAAELKRIGSDELARQVVEEIVPIFRDYRLTLEALTAEELARVSELRGTAETSGDMSIWLLAASGIMGITLALVVAVFITRSIMQPLGKLEEAAVAVSQGDLDARSSVTAPRELAKLGNTINAMVATVQERTRELEERNRQLLDARALASTDGLTGVLNHRAFQEQIRQQVASASLAEPLSLIMLDLDGFKKINDRLGHQKGDELLRACTEACVTVVGRDCVYRYGGDEIAVIVPNHDLDEACLVAERIRNLVLESESEHVGITISLGVATCPSTASTTDELTYQADAAMYAAKSTGKNRVCRFDQIAQTPHVPGFLSPDGEPLTLSVLANALGISEEAVVAEIRRVLGDTNIANALLEGLGGTTGRTPPTAAVRK